MTTPNDAFAAAYKPVLRAMADAMTLSLAAAARTCELSLKAVNDSLSEADEITKGIDTAKDIPSLLEIQARLGRSCFERASRNWSGVCMAVAENQMEMLHRGQAQIARIGDDIRAATMNGFSQQASPAGTWQSFMEAASNAYALTAKATEEMTRMASAQLNQNAAMESPTEKPAAPEPEPEIQLGHGRSKAKDDRLKRVLKQHPQRDEPRVDSVEPDETPP